LGKLETGSGPGGPKVLQLEVFKNLGGQVHQTVKKRRSSIGIEGGGVMGIPFKEGGTNPRKYGKKVKTLEGPEVAATKELKKGGGGEARKREGLGILLTRKKSYATMIVGVAVEGKNPRKVRKSAKKDSHWDKPLGWGTAVGGTKENGRGGGDAKGFNVK